MSDDELEAHVAELRQAVTDATDEEELDRLQDARDLAAEAWTARRLGKLAPVSPVVGVATAGETSATVEVNFAPAPRTGKITPPSGVELTMYKVHPETGYVMGVDVIQPQQGAAAKLVGKIREAEGDAPNRFLVEVEGAAGHTNVTRHTSWELALGALIKQSGHDQPAPAAIAPDPFDEIEEAYAQHAEANGATDAPAPEPEDTAPRLLTNEERVAMWHVADAAGIAYPAYKALIRDHFQIEETHLMTTRDRDRLVNEIIPANAPAKAQA
ncbi:hypothetical protein D3C72_830060 [compost metagenome]